MVASGWLLEELIYRSKVGRDIDTPVLERMVDVLLYLTKQTMSKWSTGIIHSLVNHYFPQLHGKIGLLIEEMGQIIINGIDYDT